MPAMMSYVTKVLNDYAILNWNGSDLVLPYCLSLMTSPLAQESVPRPTMHLVLICWTLVCQESLQQQHHGDNDATCIAATYVQSHILCSCDTSERRFEFCDRAVAMRQRSNLQLGPSDHYASHDSVRM
jgi:hypothetical protein